MDQRTSACSVTHHGERAYTRSFYEGSNDVRGAYGLFQFNDSALVPNSSWKKSIASELKQSTDEVRSCAKRADFLGKWLAMAGSPGTVMAILGLKA